MTSADGSKYRWDLRKLFPTDEDWQACMERTLANVEKMVARKGHLADSAAALLETANLHEAIYLDLYDLFVYAHSNFDTDMSDPVAKSLYETAETRSTEIGEKLSFLAPELMKHSYEEFVAFCEEEPALKLYDKFARDFFSKKEHILSDEMEETLVRMNDLGDSFQKAFRDLTVNDANFPTIQDPQGEDFSACESNYHVAMGDPDRNFREAYFKGLLGTYGAYINTLTSLYYGSVKNDVFLAKTRRYTSARQMEVSRNFVSEEVYDNLIAAVRENTAPLQEYVVYRKEQMGISDIHFYDLFVPIVADVEKKYTFEEAKDLVLKATAILGEDYTALLQRAFDERWIDVYPGKNKRSGAYSTGTFRSYPYVLLNFTGTLDDVFTLAHELGHSIHTYFSCHTQPFIYSDYSIFCAEVASTTNELLLSQYLYDHADTKEEKALLLDKKLNDLRSTFYRQTMFADFENETHKRVEAGQPLLPKELCELHGELNRIYYGEDFIVDKELTYEWARIPHFYNMFYVYQYATGIAAATAITRRILSEGAPAVADYRAFLSGGSSQHPIEMLRVAGVDMASPQPVLDTTDDFRDTLKKLKEL